MAHYSKISICNMALAMLGADSIRDFDESNKRARLADILYESCKNYMLFRFDWPFARAFKNLQELDLSDEDTPTGTHLFQVPSDCVVPRDVHPPGSKDKWDVIGDRIITHNTSVGLYYTKEGVTPNKFSDTFANLVALFLAVKLSPPITQDVKVTSELHRQYLIQIRDDWEADANVGNVYREFDEDPNNDTFVYPPGVDGHTSN